MNISNTLYPEEQISKLLALIGQPVRIQILVVISEQEACVCHLETVLKMRQASISQHLMVLRRDGLVASQREGRNIFYRLNQPAVLEILRQAAAITHIPLESWKALALRPVPGCPCPQCNPDIDPPLTCRIGR